MREQSRRNYYGFPNKLNFNYITTFSLYNRKLSDTRDKT